MSESNGVLNGQSPPDGVRPSSGRVSSTSAFRSVQSSSESPPPESVPWSSAIGHAGTGKSGRVIERLQGDIDRLRRERQLLTTRLEESEKQTENLKTRNQSLQDRTSNYEQSHEATFRQLSRRERQVEELREELRKEKLKTAQAEAQAAAASSNEEEWRNQAHQAKAIAVQREAEYDTMVDCRKVDYNRHQAGLDKLRSQISAVTRRKDEDFDKQKKLEIIAEQQGQTIAQLEEINKKLTTNFKAYRQAIDSDLSGLREKASQIDETVAQKLEEMAEVTGRMRWVMNLEETVPHHRVDQQSTQPEYLPNGNASRPQTANDADGKRNRSPSKLIKHRRKDSSKVTK
ncbi:mother-specific HO expression [Cladophialophora chaetospira]|uniref:Mother-specific HO expression n=1 Tax=Cladophialophora chaetospira TaxID=386627 RepID=A0AA38XLQ8_9EURO|nr:mother-specific HO expression [Cladophialophora chaetospira]